MKKATKVLLSGAACFLFSVLAGEYIVDSFGLNPPGVMYACGLAGIIFFIIGFVKILILSNRGE